MPNRAVVEDRPAAARWSPPPWRRLLPVAAAGLAIAGVALALQFARLSANRRGGDPTAPFVVGTAWRLDEELAELHVEATVSDGPGYDGQWFLGLAYDPLLRRRLAVGFDMPRYRARRPLDAMTGWLLAAGRRAAIPAGLLAVGPLAAALGAAACGRIAAAHGRSRWWGAGFALIPGAGVGVMFGTAEPLGLALAALGLGLALARRPVGAGLAFAAAALTKETYLAFALAAAAHRLWVGDGPPRRRAAAAVALLAPGGALLGGWWLYVAWRIPPVAGDSLGAGAFSLPPVGWVGTLHAIASGRYVADAPVGPLGPALLLATFALLLVGVWVGLRSRSLPAWTAALLGVYGLALDGSLLGHFLSAMRALAPCVLPCGLALLTTVRLPHLRGAAGPTAA